MDKIVESHKEECLVCGYIFEEARYLHDEDSTILQGNKPFIRKTIHKGERILLDLLACPECKYIRLLS